VDFGAVWLLAVAGGLAAAGRRFPVTAAAGNLAVTMVWYRIGYASSLVNVPYLVAFYLLGASGDRRKQLVVGCLAVVLSGAAIVTSEESAATAASAIGWTVAPMLLGELAYNRRALLDELAARADRAEGDREREAQRRVAQSRLDIARDLHDVLSHTVSVMTVQAGAAQDAIARDPAAAEAALRTIRDAGRGAAAEVQALIAVLRSEAEPPGTAPAPTLERVADLADAARGAGIAVRLDLDVSGGVSDVVQLTAYRVVQESLTNIVRHSSARSAVVSIRRTASDLRVEVHDDGQISGPVTEGFGLRGMRERVAALGGSLSVGPDSCGGWRVSANLPDQPRSRR
jgi:signal transduction histidine kinase